jgi:hypothetical protein
MHEHTHMFVAFKIFYLDFALNMTLNFHPNFQLFICLYSVNLICITYFESDVFNIIAVIEI